MDDNYKICQVQNQKSHSDRSLFSPSLQSLIINTTLFQTGHRVMKSCHQFMVLLQLPYVYNLCSNNNSFK